MKAAKIINTKTGIFITLFLSAFFLFIRQCSSREFLTDGIAASVDNTPITLNELYFLYNFGMINDLKYRKIGEAASKNDLRRSLTISINRLLILKQEKKIGGIPVSDADINSFAADFKKKFGILHKNIKFDAFLKTFGFDERTFDIYVKDILLEKLFINERLRLFLFTLENAKGIDGGALKENYAKRLSSKLKDLLSRLRAGAKIEINGNY